jgi:hypothetical protein
MVDEFTPLTPETSVSQPLTRPTLLAMLVALVALGACANPTAPTRSLKPGVSSADLITDPPSCKDSGWAGSSGRC